MFPFASIKKTKNLVIASDTGYLKLECWKDGSDSQECQHEYHETCKAILVSMFSLGKSSNITGEWHGSKDDKNMK